ncbi:hypothetical protein ACQ4PT_047911 [Festuca glaucescens]
MHKGISSAARHRVSICIQILTRPALLFLDEPTSGLDSATSYHVVSWIARLVRREGMTVIAAVHQPSTEVYGLFHGLCLLTAVRARAARKSFESSEGDHITLVNVYRAAAECLEKSKNANAKEKTMEKALNRWCWENFINYRSLRHARDVHSQIQGHVQQMGLNLSSCGDDMVQFRRCLTAAFFLNAAIRQPDGSFRVLGTGQSVQMHPSSVLFRTKPDCVIFNELVRTTQNYVKNLTRIDPLWLAELAPQYYATED